MDVIEAIGAPLYAKARARWRDRWQSEALDPDRRRFTLNEKLIAASGSRQENRYGNGRKAQFRRVNDALQKKLARRDRRHPGVPLGLHPRNIVLVVSALAGEGKSYCAANLALDLALDRGQQATLIDANIDNPQICRLLGAGQQIGAADYIAGLAPRELAVQWAEGAPLAVIGLGDVADRDFMKSPAYGEMLRAVSRGNGDGLVYIDGPCVLGSGDVTALAGLADEIVLVIEAHATPQPAIAAAIGKLTAVTANVSLILNHCLFAGGKSR